MNGKNIGFMILGFVMKMFGEVIVMDRAYYVCVLQKEGIVGFTCISNGIQMQYFDDYNVARDCMRQLFSAGIRKLFLFKWDVDKKFILKMGGSRKMEFIVKRDNHLYNFTVIDEKGNRLFVGSFHDAVDFLRYIEMLVTGGVNNAEEKERS